MEVALLTNWKTIEIKDLKLPKPGKGEVLVRVHYAGICGSDVHIFNGTNPVARVPVVPGHEFMGAVLALGDTVRGPEIGSRVVVQPLKFCGHCKPCQTGTPHVCRNLTVIGVNQDGGFAEAVLVPSDAVFEVPAALKDRVATLAEPFSISTHALGRGQLSHNDRVLITGAGPIGLFTAIFARKLGAKSIVLTEPNAPRRANAASFGFTVLDPAQTDTAKTLQDMSDAEGYDLVIETSGHDAGLDLATEIAAVRGRIVTLGFPHNGFAQIGVTRTILKELSIIGSRVCTREEFQKTVDTLLTLQMDGDIDFEKLIAKSVPLSALADAIRDVESGSEIGKILIQLVDNDE